MTAKVKTLDFNGVEDKAGGFRPRRKPAGEYYARITAVDNHKSENNDGWVFTIKIDGDARNSYPYYCMFSDNQLWKIRNLCIAAGIKVPQAKVKLDPSKLVGKAIGVILEDDEYEGREKSTIDEVLPPADMDDPRNTLNTSSKKAASKKAAEADDDEDEDEDDEPTPKKGKASKKRAPEPDDDEDEDDDEDDEPPAKKSKAKGKAASKKKPVEDDEDEDDEDDEDEPPAKKSKAKAKSSKKSKKSRDDDDDDEELDLDDL